MSQRIVLAIDAAINQHLGETLGLSAQEAAAIPPLGREIERIKRYLRGSVYQQWNAYAQGYGVHLCVIGNKAAQEEDLAFLREHTGSDLLTWSGCSASVRAREKGQVQPLLHLEEKHLRVLDTIKATADACEKDWTTFSSISTAKMLSPGLMHRSELT
jgi:hypothetical protein